MFFLKELPGREILENYHRKFPEMNVDAVEGALKLMHRASMLIRGIDAFFAGHDFSQLRFFICIVIDRDPEVEGLTPGEITERIGVSKPVVTRALKSLEKAGYVSLQEHETDKRAKLVVLTDRARLKLEAVLPGYYALMDDFMSKEEESHG